jgi:hypothetical protein
LVRWHSQHVLVEARENIVIVRIITAARKSPAGPFRLGPEFAVSRGIGIDCRHGGLLWHANHIALILVCGIDPFVKCSTPFGLALIHTFQADGPAAVHLSCFRPLVEQPWMMRGSRGSWECMAICWRLRIANPREESRTIARTRYEAATPSAW